MSALLTRLDREADSYLFDLIVRLYERAQAPLLGSPEPGVREGDMIIFDTAEDARTAFYETDSYYKDLALIESFGQSRFSTNGQVWQYHRDITQPKYTNIARPQYKQTIIDFYRKGIERITLNDPDNIQHLLLDSSLSIFNFAFNPDTDAKNILRIYARIRKMLKVLQYLSWADVGNEDTVNALRSEVEYFLGHLESEGRTDPVFAGLLRCFRDESGSIENFRIVSEYLINSFAGSETSVTAILWAIDRLGAMPEFQEKLAAMDPDSPEGEQALEALINETLRYFPPIPLVIRRLAQDMDYRGGKLREGELIVVSIIGLHHSTDYWTNPQDFDPERPEFAEKTYNRQAFVPFAAGPRVCGGMRLARIEVREALRLFIKRFRVTRTAEQISFDYGLVLRPRDFMSWKLDYR